MPNNWKKYKLNDIAEIVMGQSPSGDSCTNNPSDGLPLLNGPTEFGYSYPTPVQYTKDSRKKSEVGDLLFCVRGSTTGKMNFSNKVYSIGRGIAAIRGKNSYPTKFVKYLIDMHLPQMLNVTTGSTFPNIGKDDLNNVSVEVPDSNTAIAIAEILSSLDDKIESNLQTNKTLEEMANALYKHWFVDFGPFKDGKFVESELGLIPEGWDIGVLGDLVNFYNGYGFKSGDLLDDNIGDCYHVFKMGHIKKGGGLKSDGTRSFVQKSKCNKLENFILKKGDLLMSMTDMKDKVSILGHTAIMDEDDKYIVNQRVGLLRAKKELGIDYPYLYILSNSVPFLNDLRSRANSGVQVNLSTEGIKNTTVLIAPKIIHEEFNKIVLSLFEKTFENAKENQTLTQTRDYLLPKLISGEVRVKDAEKTVKEMI